MRAAITLVIALVSMAGTAEAQPRRQPPQRPPARPPARIQQPEEKFRLSFNVGSQVLGQTINQDVEGELYLEPAPISNRMDLTGGGLFDVGGMYHLRKQLWVGAAFSMISQKVSGDITGKLPHPFHFDQPRDITGTQGDFRSKERGLHVSVGYLIPLTKTLDMMILGGPSLLSLRQDVITGVDYSEDYPYDTARFVSAPTESVSASKMGFNVGSDVSWKLSKTIRFGGLIRFTRSSATLKGEAGDVDVDLGGLTAGAGIRVVF
jgi:hypothetical protein